MEKLQEHLQKNLVSETIFLRMETIHGSILLAQNCIKHSRQIDRPLDCQLLMP